MLLKPYRKGWVAISDDFKKPKDTYEKIGETYSNFVG